MSAAYQTYNGIVKARSGKGQGKPQCSANVSEVIPVGLSPEDAISAYRTKYGDTLIADWICAHWKVEIQKPGQNSLKADLATGTGLEPDLNKASAAIIACAKSDMIPQRRGSGPKTPPLTSDDVRKQAEDAGIKGGKLDAFISSLLESGKIKS